MPEGYTLISAMIGSVLIFALGIYVGVKLTVFGYKLGWSASYQLRGDPQDDDKSLFGTSEEMPESDILAEQDKQKPTNIMTED